MTTITVTSLENDVSNVNSLAYAISKANSGDIDSIVISSTLNGKTFDFSSLESLDGTSEDSLTTIYADYGTVSGLSGTLVASGATAYGIAGFGSQSGTLELSAFTGTITAHGAGEAAGVLSRYESGSGTQSVKATGTVAGSLSVTSDSGDAYGFCVKRKYTGNTSAYSTSASLTVDAMSMHISVTAGGVGHGLFAQADQAYYYYPGNVSKATATLSAGDLTGHITVSGVKGAYGLYSAALNACSCNATLAVGDISGSIEVSSEGIANGLYSSQAMTAGTLSGKVTAVSDKGDACGLWTAQAMYFKGVAVDGTISVKAAKAATGVSAAGSLDLDEMAGRITTKAGTGIATGFWVSKGTIAHFSGEVDASSESGSAYGILYLDSQSGTLELSDFTGTITAHGSSESAGVFSRYESGSGTQSVSVTGGTTGALTVTSDGGDAYGIGVKRKSNWNSSAYSSTANLTLDALSMDVAVTAGGVGYGLFAQADQVYYYTYNPSRAMAALSAGNVTGHVTVSGVNGAYGMYAAALNAASCNATLSVGDISGSIEVSSEKGHARGLYSNGSITITGNISGDVYISSGESVAAFIRSTNTVINNGYNTIIIKEEVKDDETGEVITPAETVQQLQASEVSGSIVVDGFSGAYGILASGDSMVSISGLVAAGNFQSSSTEKDKEELLDKLRNFDLKQWYASTLINQASTGYAYADGLLNNGVFAAKNSKDDLHIADGALILGKIDLGGGANSLTIDSGAQIFGDITADSLSLSFNLNSLLETPVITATKAGALSSANTTWTINIAEGLQSGRYVLAKVENGLNASAMDNYSVKVNAFGEEYEITFADELDKLGFADINVTENGEIEFIYSDTFFVIGHNLRDNYISTQNNGTLTLNFTGRLDESSFSLDMVSMTDENGNAVSFTGYAIDGSRLTLEYEPIATEGIYTLALSNAIGNANGKTLDQNRNQFLGEEDDAYRVQFKTDLTRPRVTRVEPEEDFAGTLTTLRVYFSEAVKLSTANGQMELVTPDGSVVKPSGSRLLSGNCVEMTVSAQTAIGEYKVRIHDGITDLAGNALDTRTETGVYERSFHIAKVDLKVAEVELSKSIATLGELITVSWTDYNNGGYELFGSWTDGVYLSTDTRWDTGDILLGKVSHDGGLAADGESPNHLDVSLSGVTEGTYYLLVRSDIY
ncbi:MAG: Ig-like domain-containing protein, partial [Victivallales bacterium]|nr:Ig-like domain-containing protein [Victivallales bacterium]